MAYSAAARYAAQLQHIHRGAGPVHSLLVLILATGRTPKPPSGTQLAITPTEHPAKHLAVLP